jgi:gliding motility-associated protein GldL
MTQVKEYQDQIQMVTKNLNSLNAIYELELQDSQKHIASISKFFGSISNVMQNMLETSKDTDQLRQEVSNLTKNLHTLNNIYGGMLGAMATAAKA